MRILRLLSVFFLFLPFGTVSLGAQESAIEAARRPPRPVGYPVKPGIWRLHGTAPDLPQEDLAPFQQIVGKATVVALGESVHTSGGYYEAKHRLLRYLVEQMGFRVLAFESSWVNAERVARYVETCDGSAGQSVSDGLFHVWYSAEVRALVQWMCDWNGAHPDDRLHFYGFDIQFQQKADGEALIDFLSRAGLPEDDSRIAGVRKCDGVVESFYPNFPEDRHRQCKDALAAIADLFAREEPEVIERTSREDFEWAKVRWTGLDTFEDQIYFQAQGPRSSEIRDRGMASVFQAIRNLRHPGAKTVIWAHNFHIAKNAAGHFPYATMGTFLGQSLQADYVNVALVSHEVSIDWQGLGCGPADPPGEGAVENLFHDLGEDFLLIDLDFPKGRPPFLKKGKVYELGWYPIVPRRHYDALVYLDVSPKMAPLGWRPCR